MSIVIGRVEGLEDGIRHPLLTSEVEKDEEADQEFDESEESSEDSHKPANSISSAYRLLTPSVKVHIFHCTYYTTFM